MKKMILTVLAVATIVLIPSMSFASIDGNLSYGSHGAQVTELQEFLIDKGFLQTQSTGNFYSLTLKAIKAFQTANSIPSTGYVGVLTRTEINSQLAADTSGSTAQQLTETGTTTTVTPPSPVITQLQQQNNLLQQQLTQLQTQTQNQAQQTQAIQNSLNQVVQNTTPITKPTTTPTPTLPACAKNGYVINCMSISPTTVQGGATTTFTITTSAYRFGNDVGNTGYEACADSMFGSACVGYTSNDNKGSTISVSPDYKTLTYTVYIPDNVTNNFVVSTNGLFDDAIPQSANNYVNKTAGQVGPQITVTNSTLNTSSPASA